MKFELAEEDLAGIQNSIIESSVGKALMAAIKSHLESEYKMEESVRAVLNTQVRKIALDMIENDTNIQDRILKAIKEAFTDDLIRDVASKIHVKGY
jgi:peptide subunit release factor RF-3